MTTPSTSESANIYPLSNLYSETCPCGKEFYQPNSFSLHLRSCKGTKKRLSVAQNKWGELVKRRRTAKRDNLVSAPVAESSQDNLEILSGSEAALNLNDMNMDQPEALQAQQLVVAEEPEGILGPRVRRLPKRYEDFIAEPPVILSASLPSPSASTPHMDAAASALSSEALSPTAGSIICKTLDSPKNIFGLFRRYHAEDFPKHDPESHIILEDLVDVVGLQHKHHTDNQCYTPQTSQSFHPYPNESSFQLGNWYWNGGVQKSQEGFKNLVDIVSGPTFCPEDIRNVNWASIDAQLGQEKLDDDDEWFDIDAGWCRSSISLLAPFHRRTTNPGPRTHEVSDFYHRSVISILREKLSNEDEFQHFHLEPYELHWQTSSMQQPVRVQGELYSSPAFIEAHKELQNAPAEPGCALQRVIVGLMYASDVTHLTLFGTAKLWPLYVYFGNFSKYRRCKLSSNLCEEVAYFQQLPSDFKDFAAPHFGCRGVSDAFITHCHRELFHEQWKILLDEEFLDAYKHGVVIECPDGIQRRFYLRIFTYSADYPEKIILASIRNLGNCPCPRCLIPLSQVHEMGTDHDREERITTARFDDKIRQKKVADSRKLIYQKNYAVDSKLVENILKEESLVPTDNAFSAKLAPFGFNFFQMFVIDLMHEVELGGWRSFLIHLLRILQAAGSDLLHKLDQRFRQIPTFGKDTIRRFSNNCSELKRLAARDYENLLQCAIPVFDGLLPEPHNRNVVELLYVFAHWHGLAKLRMHTDLTLDILDSLTTVLGQKLRDFDDETCSKFVTLELPREVEARKRRAAKASAKKAEKLANPTYPSASQPSQVLDPVTITQKPSAASNSQALLPGTIPPLPPVTFTPTSHSEPPPPPIQALNPLSTLAPLDSSEVDVKVSDSKVPKTRRCKRLNLNTYKHHAYGDYSQTIRTLGTTDSYSTEASELAHRSPKRRYLRTSRKKFILQLAQSERRQVRLRRIAKRHSCHPSTKMHNSSVLTSDEQRSPEQKYHIGKNQNVFVHIGRFLNDNRGDPAIKACPLEFMPSLRAHLLPRIHRKNGTTPNLKDGMCETPEMEQKQLDGILFKADRLYSHKVVRFNYTTYDVRRAEDVINPNTPHRDIMLLADVEDPSAHPFLYARVLGIFHVNIVYIGPGMVNNTPTRYDFLWVRWYEHVPAEGQFHLDVLSFPPVAGCDSFGFVDPAEVLRACHIMPKFKEGLRHEDHKGLSKFCKDGEDWKQYFIGRYAPVCGYMLDNQANQNQRFADRDMVMRFHWGLGVGHTYSHDVHNNATSLWPINQTLASLSGLHCCEDLSPTQLVAADRTSCGSTKFSNNYDDGSPLGDPNVEAELGYKERENEVLSDSSEEEGLSNGGFGGQEYDSYDEELHAEFENMYGEL